MNKIYFCLKPTSFGDAQEYNGILYVYNRSYTFKLTLVEDTVGSETTHKMEIDLNFFADYNISRLNLNLVLLYCNSIKDIKDNLVLVIEQSILNQKILQNSPTTRFKDTNGPLLFYNSLKTLTNLFYFTESNIFEIDGNIFTIYVQINSDMKLPIDIIFNKDRCNFKLVYPVNFDKQTIIDLGLLTEIKTDEELEDTLSNSINLFKNKLQQYYSNICKLKQHFMLLELFDDLIHNNSVEIHRNGLGVKIEHNMVAVLNNIGKDKCQNYLKISYFGDKGKVREETERLLELYHSEHEANTDIIDILKRFISSLFQENKTNTETEKNSNDCGICYDTIKRKPVTCSNNSCHTHYHFDCLKEWSESGLKNEELFGSVVCDCPYCNSEIIF